LAAGLPYGNGEGGHLTAVSRHWNLDRADPR
jgi:hypothetical protein